MTNFASTLLCLLARLVLASSAAMAVVSAHARSEHSDTFATAPHDGLAFECSASQLQDLLPAMDNYLARLAIDPQWVVRHLQPERGSVRYVLATPAEDTDTLTLYHRPEYAVTLERVTLPTQGGGVREVSTVSRKEIMLALMQHGRLTQFAGKACSIEALEDHVGVRQMTVAWAEKLEWGWPDGGPAKWNEALWERGTPRPGVPVAQALADAFINQPTYEIGCYTATKLVVLQGVVDYYRRVKGDERIAALVEARITEDADPLVHVEPGQMWHFEEDFVASEADRAGKVLRLTHGVAPRNFVPGDWGYFLNTDPVSYQKTGYEGSNAIYLGRDRFDDYYNDHNGGYTYRQKLHEVWQWRNGVFSRSRDAHKVVPLSEEDFVRLAGSPQHGGLLLPYRAGAYYFGFEQLPGLPSSAQGSQ